MKISSYIKMPKQQIRAKHLLPFLRFYKQLNCPSQPTCGKEWDRAIILPTEVLVGWCNSVRNPTTFPKVELDGGCVWQILYLSETSWDDWRSVLKWKKYAEFELLSQARFLFFTWLILSLIGCRTNSNTIRVGDVCSYECLDPLLLMLHEVALSHM